MSETSLMAVNRYKMRHLASQGRRSAKQVIRLLGRTDQLLASILLGNNLVNAALTTLITATAIQTFGNEDSVLAVATAIAAGLLIIFGEILPKTIGANRAEAAAMGSSHGLIPVIYLLRPFVWVLNGLISVLLRLFRVSSPSNRSEGMTTDELRTAVLESAAFIPSQHRSILLNLFDLEDLRVDDVMVARGRIEALDLEDDEATLIEQISTCFHNNLPVYRGELHQIEGILHVRKALTMLAHDDFSKERLIEALTPAYFIPSGSKLFSQLTHFQSNRQQLALVVDEYGEVEGLLTLQDIIEELVGEFSGQDPQRQAKSLQWSSDGTAVVEGASLVRDINRRLDLSLPVDGPKTINGLILEQLQDIPEANLGLKIGNTPLEIVQIQDRMIRRVLLHRPLASTQPDPESDHE
ncbi:CorB Putative Mg2+ and Co2+ transporter CorB [Burkholderiales bacterium]